MKYNQSEAAPVKNETTANSSSPDFPFFSPCIYFNAPKFYFYEIILVFNIRLRRQTKELSCILQRRLNWEVTQFQRAGIGTQEAQGENLPRGWVGVSAALGSLTPLSLGEMQVIWALSAYKSPGDGLPKKI